MKSTLQIPDAVNVEPDVKDAWVKAGVYSTVVTVTDPKTGEKKPLEERGMSCDVMVNTVSRRVYVLNRHNRRREARAYRLSPEGKQAARFLRMKRQAAQNGFGQGFESKTDD